MWQREIVRAVCSRGKGYNRTALERARATNWNHGATYEDPLTEALWSAFLDAWDASKFDQLDGRGRASGPPTPPEYDYPAAARSIHLNLREFCDETQPYPEMIADAARKARAEIERLRGASALARRRVRPLRTSGHEQPDPAEQTVASHSMRDN